MKKTIKYFFSIIFVLIFCSTLIVVNVEGNNEIPPRWEYVAPEADYLTLDGGLSQWSDIDPVTIILENMSRTGESLLMLAYFAFNDSKLYIGLYIPKQGVTIYGIEIIFIGNNGVFDGVIVDSELHEARDVAYVNSTHVAFDTDLGGYENVNVQQTDVGEDEFYMIIDDIRYPESDLDSEWEFDDGDSVAVVFQAWVSKEKDLTNRPNFSTYVNNFNYLRLSIKYDTGLPIELKYPFEMSKLSGVEFNSYYRSKLEYVLDGKKDEAMWKGVPSYPVITVLMCKTAAGSLLNSDDPKTKKVNCSFVHDNTNLLIHLEIQQEEGDTSLSDLLLFFGKEPNSLECFSSDTLVCRVNPYGTHYAFTTNKANVSLPGIIPQSDSSGIIFFNVSSWDDASGHFDLYEVECSPFVVLPTATSIEILLPLFRTEEEGGEIHFLNIEDPQLYVDGIKPFSSDESMAGEEAEPYGVVEIIEDQIKFIIHKINFTKETEETTETEFELVNTLVIISLFIGVEAILIKKSRKRVI